LQNAAQRRSWTFYETVNHKKHQEEKPVILRLHGTLGNLLDETEHKIPSILAAEAQATMTYKHIDKINLPILLIRWENDPLVENWVQEALARVARKSGNRKVRVKQTPDAGHNCIKNEVST